MKYRNAYRHSEFHQLQLLLPGQLLDPVFPAHCLFFCGKPFVIHQLHRPFGPGIFGTCLAFIVRFHPPGKAVCPAGVECAVCTLHDVCIVHSSLLFCKKFLQCNAKCQYIFSNITPGYFFSCKTNIPSAAFLLCKDSHQHFFSSHPSILKQPAQFLYFTYNKDKAGWDSGCGFSHLLYYTFISYFCEYGIRLISYGSSSMTIITGFS